MSDCVVDTHYHTDEGQDSVRRDAICRWQSSADTVSWIRGGQTTHFEMGEADAFVDAYAEARSRKGHGFMHYPNMAVAVLALTEHEITHYLRRWAMGTITGMEAATMIRQYGLLKNMKQENQIRDFIMHADPLDSEIGVRVEIRIQPDPTPISHIVTSFWAWRPDGLHKTIERNEIHNPFKPSIMVGGDL